MEELVSVVIPTYNGSKTIVRAINSVINQTYKNIEIIVVNDMSTDNTLDVVKSLKYKNLKYISVDRKVNASHARNLGAGLSQGKYIAFLDDDDDWDNIKVFKQVEYLKKNPELKSVVTDFIYIVKDNRKYIKTNSEDYTKDILMMKVKVAAGSNILLYKETYDQLNGFDESFEGHQDLEFLIRLDQLSKIGHISGFLLHINGSSYRGAKNTNNLVNIKKVFLKKFENIINNYPKKIADYIYARQWLQVSRGFALEKNFIESRKYLQLSLSYSYINSDIFKITPFESYFVIIINNFINEILNRFSKK